MFRNELNNKQRYQEQRASLLGAPGIATRSVRTLLGAKGIATRSVRTLLGAPGLTTTNKKLRFLMRPFPRLKIKSDANNLALIAHVKVWPILWA